MPTYQYQCTECGDPLEVVQSFTDDALTECPSCGGRLRKVYNAVGIVFKGSGFYRNDSRAGAGSAAKSGSEKSETKPDTKADSKPAAKSDGGASKDGSSSKTDTKSAKSTSAA